MRSLFSNLKFGIPVLLALAVWSVSLGAERPDKDKSQRGSSLEKGAGTPRWQVLNINNLATWHRSDGEGNHTPSGQDGMIYPLGTGRAIYEDNMVFGGKVYVGGFPESGGTPAALQRVRINGGTYLSHHGMDAGWVEGMGASASPVSTDLPAVRIYRIRRDYAEMTDSELRKDAQIFYELLTLGEVSQTQVELIRAQYEKDWKEWPTQYGAPYLDRNGNGKYDPPPAFSETFKVDDLIPGNYDEPGVAGADLTTPADQVLYTVYNGLRRARVIDFEASEPIGMEVQKTLWGYKRTDALGNVYFFRYRLINKGGVDIGGGTKGSFHVDSLFLCQWSDIDLGNAGDDVVGCDSLLSMGYVYNGSAVDRSYAQWNLPPPSSGYDFLAGALVDAPGDSGVFDFKRVYGKKNQGMSSFAFFSAGSPFSDPPFTDYDVGSGRWWHMLRGFAPVGTINDPPSPYPHPPGMAITKFPYSGDPVTGTGFVDGAGTTYSFAPGDRRILVNTGPFRMAPGDVQDIYVGFVVAIGGDRLSSVALMKAYDKACQETFDLLFQVAKPPKNPTVAVTELDGEIILDWTGDAATIKDTEGKVVIPGNYTFEGYNLYQFPSEAASMAAAKRIGTFDVVNGVKTVSDQVFDPVVGQFVLKPIQYGNDEGVRRYFRLKKDFVRDVDKLYNGQQYYFAVTAYSRATLPGYTAALESSPNILTVVPKVLFGKVLNATFGDTVSVTKTGASDGKVVALVVDPSKITGDSYQVKFEVTDGKDTWKVLNTTKNTTLVSGQTNQTGNEPYPLADGILVKVFGAPNDAKDFQHVANPSGPISPPTYVGFGCAWNNWCFPDPSGQVAPATDWGGGRWGINQGGAADGSYATFVSRVFRGTNFSRFVPYDFELRFTAAGGKAYMAFSSGSIVDVPFELWNIGVNTPDDPSDDYRMIPWIYDEDANDAFNLQKADHALSGGDNDPYTDWIYWRRPIDTSPGQNGYLNEFVNLGASYDTDPNSPAGQHAEVMARIVLCNVNGGSVSDPTWPANATSVMPATGNTIRIVSTKPNTPSVTYSYSPAEYAPTVGPDIAKNSAQRVGVFPNPYYTQNAAEVDRFERFVTFNNLPPKATIRIFNLAGQPVRTIEKDDNSQFLRWNLLNERNLPVASGIYIALVEMPDVGVTKLLKLAIIMEQEILDIF